jgi:hypothetical protein
VKNTVNRFSLKPREGPPPAIRRLLNDTEGVKIKSIKVGRKPIVKNVERLLNGISFGKFGKVKRKLGYDDVYHNYLIVELENGKKVKIEKNHVVESSEAKENDYQNEIRDIPVDKNVDMKTLLSNASHNDKDFYQYDASNKNCQNFTKEVVERNNFKPEDDKAKEILNPQDARSLIDSLGSLKGVPKKITDLAAGLDRAVYGNGIRNKKLTVNQLFDFVNNQ